jgi:hypothetical protein
VNCVYYGLKAGMLVKIAGRLTSGSSPHKNRRVASKPKDGDLINHRIIADKVYKKTTYL